MSVDYFRSNECKPPGDVAYVGILMISVIRYRNNHKIRVAAKSPTFIGGIHDVILEWSRGHSDYLADPSSIL